MDLPRNLYKSPGTLIYSEFKTYDTVLVNNMEEYNKAIDDGFIDSFSDALNQKVVKAEVKDVVEQPTDWRELANKAGLNKDQIKKLMKLPKKSRKKYMDSLKG